MQYELDSLLARKSTAVGFAPSSWLMANETNPFSSITPLKASIVGVNCDR
jgi:hypothetical protein